MRRYWGLSVLLTLGITLQFEGSLPRLGMLEMSGGIRPEALGGAVSGSAQTLEDSSINPAALGYIPAASFRLTYQAHFAGTHFVSAGAGLPIKALGTLSLDVDTLLSEPIHSALRDSTGTVTQQENKFSANTMVLRLGWGKEFLNLFSTGVKVGWARESIDRTSSSTIFFDFGLLTKLINGRLGIGAVARNISKNPENKGTSYNIPLQLRLGIMGRFLDLKTHDLEPSIEFYKTKGRKTSIAFGLEYTLLKLVAFRIGYDIAKDTGRFTAGVGFKIAKFKVPAEFGYAIIPFGDIGISHRVGLHFSLQKKKKKALSTPAPKIGVTDKKKKFSKEEEDRTQPVIQDWAPTVSETQGKPSKIKVAVLLFTPNISTITQEAVALSASFRAALAERKHFAVVPEQDTRDAILSYVENLEGEMCDAMQCAISIGKQLNVRYSVYGSITYLERSKDWQLIANAVKVDSEDPHEINIGRPVITSLNLNEITAAVEGFRSKLESLLGLTNQD